MDKPRLGRGLDALLGGADEPDIPAAATVETGEVADRADRPEPVSASASTSTTIRLAALGASVREHGILQPLVCRNVNGQLQLIAGERTALRAAQEVGPDVKVPIRIVDFNDQQTLEAALVENIQRSDPSTRSKKASASRSISIASASAMNSSPSDSAWPGRRSRTWSTCWSWSPRCRTASASARSARPTARS